MRYGLTERIGWFPGVTIKTWAGEPDLLVGLAGLTGRSPTDQEWRTAMAALRTKLNSILGQMFRGDFGPEGFGDAVYGELLGGHALSVALGRMRAGVFGAMDETDRQVALFHATQQGQYLAGFVADLVDKKPNVWDEEAGDWKRGAVNRRLQMYASRYRGSASISFEANSPEDAEFWWRLGPAEHCEDCLELAAESPHMKGELPVFPGDGGTACIVNCKCHLERGDGVSAFPADKGVGKWVDDTGHVPGAREDGATPFLSDLLETEEATLTLDLMPVSAAVELKKHPSKEVFAEVLAAIDSIHTDGRLPKVMAGQYTDESPFTQGYYVPSMSNLALHGKPVAVVSLLPHAIFPRVTVAHEIGHVLEVELFGSGTIMKRLAGDHWLPVADAIAASGAVQSLLAHRQFVRSASTGSIERQRRTMDYLDYLLAPEELWARAYAQFVAMSHGGAIKAELVKSLQAQKGTDGLPVQWSLRDFRAVFKAITAAMGAEGWRD